MEVKENTLAGSTLTPVPSVRYVQESATAALARPGTLAVFTFGGPSDPSSDPRCIDVPLDLMADPGAVEVWSIPHEVRVGRDGAVQYAHGGPWLLLSLCVKEDEHGGLQQAAVHAYRELDGFLKRQSFPHLLRIWNYLDSINQGNGDDERYKQFCAGRAAGMARADEADFPAATAIGHRRGDRKLHLYALAGADAGQRIENPRQISAWRYPRQYGRTAPRFARAMRLPDRGGLALSGTAAIVGHKSRHDDDLRAQIDETLANLQTLVGADGGSLGGADILKVYVRLSDDLPVVRDVLSTRLPDVQFLYLSGDVCRAELLIEIDGWHYP